jgi:site-specific DNA-cytosine methylase
LAYKREVELKVLIACEFSGIVRDAFTARGHIAISCDLLPTEKPGIHWQGDVLQFYRDAQSFDMMIAHPPCTFLAVSGNRWMKERPERHIEREKALGFVRALMGVNIPKICIENPKSVISSRIRKADQIIQPWQFGHLETKETHLWLKGLPLLIPTTDMRGEMVNLSAKERGRCHHAAPGPNRWKERSRTFAGIASAMAEQWG